MDQNDISAILPAEESPQQHYIQNSQFFSKPSVQEEPANVTLISVEFPNIFYGKMSMKILLEERSLVCQHLKIKLKPGSQKKVEPDIPIQDLQVILADLFKQCPTAFDPLHFVFIFDCGTAYGFFSGDGKYVPMCKRCNSSTYIVIRNNIIKILCSNSKCKIKILAQIGIELQNKLNARRNETKQIKPVQKIKTEKVETSKQEQQHKRQRAFTKEQLNMIKKTAKKISHS